MTGSHPFLRPSDQNIYADYDRHTAEATELLEELYQSLSDRTLPERHRLFQITQLSCSLWEYRMRGIQEMAPEWQARRSRDRQRLREALSLLKL